MKRCLAVSTLVFGLGFLTGNSMAQTSPTYKPCFDEPVFEETAFAKPNFVVPEFENEKVIKTEIEKPVFEKSLIEEAKFEKPERPKAEFVPLEFDNGCTKASVQSKSPAKVTWQLSSQPAKVSLMKPLAISKKRVGSANLAVNRVR
jgi:hypothetical protein